MRPLLRWIGIALGGLVGLGIVAYAVLYVLSERVLRRTYEVPAVSLTIPTDSASIIEGRRLATVRGCFADCHGKQAEGKVMFDQPMIARVVAPILRLLSAITAMRNSSPLSGMVCDLTAAAC